MPIRRTTLLLILALASLLAASAVRAEKADRDKPVNIESDRMEHDDTRQVSTFIGRVVLVQGTLVIRADRLVLRQDADGNQFGVATGKPATFRQKRDEVDQYIEGEGLTIDYDGKVDVLTLRERAVLRRLEQDKLMDEVHGALIIYRGESEFYTVDGAEQGGTGRARLTIQPRNKNAQTAPPPPAQPATSLKPADTLRQPGNTR